LRKNIKTFHTTCRKAQAFTKMIWIKKSPAVGVVEKSNSVIASPRAIYKRSMVSASQSVNNVISESMIVTILKTKNGREIDTEKFKYYGFGDYVRKNIDEHWGEGKSLEQNKTKKYEVRLVASVEANAYCTKTVEAENEDDAVEIAKEDVSRWDWEIDDIQDVDDVDVDNVEEVGEDED